MLPDSFKIPLANLLELNSIWESDTRLPTLQSRRAWSLARGLPPNAVNAWWWRKRGRANAKRGKGKKLSNDLYDLPVGTPPAAVEEVAVKEEVEETVEVLADNALADSDSPAADVIPCVGEPSSSPGPFEFSSRVASSETGASSPPPDAECDDLHICARTDHNQEYADCNDQKEDSQKLKASEENTEDKNICDLSLPESLEPTEVDEVSVEATQERCNQGQDVEGDDNDDSFTCALCSASDPDIEMNDDFQCSKYLPELCFTYPPSSRYPACYISRPTTPDPDLSVLWELSAIPFDCRSQDLWTTQDPRELSSFKSSIERTFVIDGKEFLWDGSEVEVLGEDEGARSRCAADKVEADAMNLDQDIGEDSLRGSTEIEPSDCPTPQHA